MSPNANKQMTIAGNKQLTMVANQHIGVAAYKQITIVTNKQMAIVLNKNMTIASKQTRDNIRIRVGSDKDSIEYSNKDSNGEW